MAVIFGNDTYHQFISQRVQLYCNYDLIVQAKGYRVGPVYDDVLAMAWFFLELIVKSMALEKMRLFYHYLPLGRL